MLAQGGFRALCSGSYCGCKDGRVTELRTIHTADLDGATLEAARALLDVVFEGDFSDRDWEHALGGVHALVWEGGDVIGHASVVQRRLLHGGRALRAGYVEGVGVRADRRRRGHGAAMMAALERVVRGAYELGALSATDEARAFTPHVAGSCGRGRPRHLPPPPSRAPRKRTGRSTLCRWQAGSTCPVSSPATGATATSGDTGGPGPARRASREHTRLDATLLPAQSGAPSHWRALDRQHRPAAAGPVEVQQSGSRGRLQD